MAKEKRPVLNIDQIIGERFERALLEFGVIKVPGFGIFEIKRCKGGGTRIIHGKEVDTPDYNRLSFRPKASLKRAVKQYAG